jgi:hypothetical protein
MATTFSPRWRDRRAYTRLPMASVWKNGGSSFTNPTKRSVLARGRPRRSRAISSMAATPVALSLAPGEPNTES